MEHQSTRKETRGKRGKKERGKLFQTKEENENISFNFYLQVLMLVIMKYKYNYINIKTTHNYLTFSSNFLSFDSCALIFLCFYFVWQTAKYLVSHLLGYSEAGIESCSVKHIKNSVNFFYKMGFSFPCSLLNKNAYKLLKMKSSTDILLELWSKGRFCSFTDQLFFLYICEWLLPINKCDQIIRQMKSNKQKQ